MSKLRTILDSEAFEATFEDFLRHADENAISGRGRGGQTPGGFYAKPVCDGATVAVHYGQGGASKTPYLNWWVVSIYYIPENGNIVLGIEESRYSHLKEMRLSPLRYSKLGNKKENVAVFYETTKSSLKYKELREKFLAVSEEVMRLGLK